MKYRFFDIRWDTDGQYIPSLPTEITIDANKFSEGFDPVNDGADYLSDRFWFCVFGFNVEKIP